MDQQVKVASIKAVISAVNRLCPLPGCSSLTLSLLLLHRQENQDQLLHRVAGLRRPAGVGAGDALRRHRAGAPALDLRPDLLPGAHLAGRAADHRVHPAPVLHRPGQVRAAS